MFYHLSSSCQIYCCLLPNIAIWIFEGVYSGESKFSSHVMSIKQFPGKQTRDCGTTSVSPAEHLYKFKALLDKWSA
jgi:hypothetical protein